MSCLLKEFRCYSKTKQNQQHTHSPVCHVFFWAEILYNQPLSLVVFERNTPAPKSGIICVCRLKGKAPLNIHVNNVACLEIMVLANTRHLLLVTALTGSTINMPKFRPPSLIQLQHAGEQKRLERKMAGQRTRQRLRRPATA